MERKIDQEFFDRNKGLFEDFALTDPDYPTGKTFKFFLYLKQDYPREICNSRGLEFYVK